MIDDLDDEPTVVDRELAAAQVEPPFVELARPTLEHLVLAHRGPLDETAYAALAQAVAAALPDVVVHHVLGDARLELPSDSTVVLPLYPHSSETSWRCGKVALGTTIVWFAFAAEYRAAVVASIVELGELGDVGELDVAHLVFVAEDLRDRSATPIYARDVRATATAVAGELGRPFDVVFFAGDAGEMPAAIDWLSTEASGKHVVLVPLTHVCEGDGTAQIDRELVPLASASGALSVRRAPALGARLAPLFASLAQRAQDD